MLVIGVTGSLGTGKSTVAQMFKKYGAMIVDADRLTHLLLAKNGKCYKKVAKIFPDAILKQGRLDRSLLANIVFNDPRKLKKLTDILYPEAFKQIKQIIRSHRRKNFIVLDVPLLFEAKWDRLTDVNIVVVLPKKQQYQRLKDNKGFTQAQINQRLKYQFPLSQKRLLADMVIDNKGDLSHTEQQVEAIYQRLQRRR